MPTPDYADMTPAGYGGAYSSISSCIAGENRDFVSADVNAIWEYVGAGWGIEGPDITSGGIYGGVCDATRNILIRADAINRASAQWDPSKAYIHVDGGWPCFELDQTHITIDGIQMTSNQGVVGYNCTGLVVENCHILRDGDVGGRGLHGQSDGAVIRNCVIDGFERGVDVGGSTDHLVDHCTIVNGWWAVQGADGAVVTNTLCFGQEVSSFPVAVLSGSSNNATGDTDTAGTAGLTEISDPFVNYAGGDYHLDPTDVQGIIGGGVATLAFDIDGYAYLDPPSIGAHEGAEASGEIDPIGENVEVLASITEGLSAIAETSLIQHRLSQGLAAIAEGSEVQPRLSEGLAAIGEASEVQPRLSQGLSAIAEGLVVGPVISQGLAAIAEAIEIGIEVSQALSIAGENSEVFVSISRPISTESAEAQAVEVQVFANAGLSIIGRHSEVITNTSVGISAIAEALEVQSSLFQGLSIVSESSEVPVGISEGLSEFQNQGESLQIEISISRGLSAIGRPQEIQTFITRGDLPLTPEIQSTLRDDLLPTIDELRNIPGKLGFRRYTVDLVRRTGGDWKAGVSSTDEIVTPLTVAGGFPPKVVFASASDYARGLPADVELIVGPFTPSYTVDGYTGGYTYEELNDSSAPKGATTFYLVKGDGFPAEGAAFVKASFKPKGALGFMLELKRAPDFNE